MEKTVEAVICGHEITSAEVDAFIASLPREQQVYASHPDFRKQCVDQTESQFMHLQNMVKKKS